MRWFRYRRGGVRVTHRVESIDGDGLVRSWCRLLFAPAEVEEIGEHVAAHPAGGAAVCAACIWRWEAATDVARGSRARVLVQDDGSLATLLRKAQWLLDDAAFYLPEGRCSSEECELLATTLDELAALVRERAARGVTIDPSAE